MLRAATVLLVEPTDDLFLGAARRAVRGIVMARGERIDGLPTWVSDAVPDDHLATINEWLGAQDWPAQAAWIRSRGGSDALYASVHDTAILYPENGELHGLERLLRDAHSGGPSLEHVLAAGERQRSIGTRNLDRDRSPPRIETACAAPPAPTTKATHRH
jgi:hypothetical protein